MSHRHKFIFLHSLKTAGSAITISLLRYLDRDDLWLTAPEAGIIHDTLIAGYVPPPATHPTVLAALEEQHGADLVHKIMETPRLLDLSERRAFARTYMALQHPHPSPSWQHIRAEEARTYLGEEIWNSYFKFSCERNPWDRMVSLYWWRHRRDETPEVSFREFIESMRFGSRKRRSQLKASYYSNLPYYTIDDELIVDYLCQYESLADDLQEVADKIGIPFDGWLPQSKSGLRKSSLAELYDSETATWVGEVFEREIALFGYQPPAALTTLSRA